MFAKSIGFRYNTHMDTTLHNEVLSLIATREDAINSIIEMCARKGEAAPSEAEFAAMTTDEVVKYEDSMQYDLAVQADLEEEWYAMRMADERIDEGFDPYMGGYTNDC